MSTPNAATDGKGASDNNQWLAMIYGFFLWQMPENVNNSAYHKQSSDSLLFLKTYAVVQEKVLNDKLLVFQKSTKKCVNFLAGDINLVKFSLKSQDNPKLPAEIMGYLKFASRLCQEVKKEINIRVNLSSTNKIPL